MVTGSNRRPSACKADALPAELTTRIALRSGRHFRDWARGVNGFLQKKVRLPRKWSERLNLGQNSEKTQRPARSLRLAFHLQRLNMRLGLLQSKFPRHRLSVRFGNQIMVHIQRPGLPVQLTFLDDGVATLTPADGIAD